MNRLVSTFHRYHVSMRIRLDKFLQMSKLVRRRTLAHTLCEAGRVRINGAAAKPSAPVKLGDVITISRGERRLVAKVLAVPERLSPSQQLVEVLGRMSVEDLKSGTRDSGLGTR